MSIATFRLAREAEEAKLKAAQETEKPAEPAVKQPVEEVKVTSTASASMKAKPRTTTLKSDS
jgi:hypothetical protein